MNNFFCFLLLANLAQGADVSDSRGPAPDWETRALEASAGNRAEITRAVEKTPPAEKADLKFLLENMPSLDLRTLSAEFLLDNEALAQEAFTNAPWRNRVPREIFLNEILPYSCANETRDNWRPILHTLCAPLVADCQTPAEAAQRLNEKLFKLANVRYSTARRKADQSPLETIGSGLASCTGLSILLIEACRSVGVPARLAGTPMWVNMRGNHTWVEVWDDGWHFTGAAEPDAKGLDHGWFQADAAQALKDSQQHAIYATSFQKTGLSFPMDWAPDLHWVSAINVTDRYTPKSSAPTAGRVRLLVEVLDQLAGKRVTAHVAITDMTNGAVHFEGSSRGESADLNDLLAFDLPADGDYQIQADCEGQQAGRQFRAGTNSQAMVVISMNDTPVYKMSAQYCVAPPPLATLLRMDDQSKLRADVTDFFRASTNSQAEWKFPARLDKLLRENEPAVRRAVWEAYRAAPIHQAFQQDFNAHQVRFQEYLSPYTLKTVGVRPAGGWPVFIAMHGGGGVEKSVNDSQWRMMQRYYRDHPEVGGYLYLALRAPNDSWNGFYDSYIYPLIDNLVRQFLLFGDANPDKIFLMGYSHGGYGAFAIGPKEPDLFAAIHASAAAPTEGETTPKTLRNTLFTCMVGEKDTMYGRLERDEKFRDSIRGLREGRTDIYPVTVKIIPGNGHGGLPDRDMIAEMYPAVRNTAPRELTWLMTDAVIQDFFWLHTDAPGKQKEIDAICRDNKISVTTVGDVVSASVLLDGRLIDFNEPVTLTLNGQQRTLKLKPSLRVLCESLQRRGDPQLAFTAEVKLAP